MNLNGHNDQRVLPFLKFQTWWEIGRAGLIWFFFSLVIVPVFLIALILIYWLEIVLFGRVSSGVVVFLSTVSTLLFTAPLRDWTQSFVDYLFFPDTVGFIEKIDAACHVLPEIRTRANLKQYLGGILPFEWQVHGIFLHDQPGLEIKGSLTLPLEMGSRSLGYLTIGPKHSGRTFSRGEKQALERFQEQISLVLSGIQLAEAQTAVEKADQMKSNFLTNISHELTTPLNVVINSTGLVADGALGQITREQQEYLSRAVNGSEYLMRLLNDILDITKLETGQLTLRLEEIAISDVIEDALSIITGVIQNKPIELHVEIEDNLPLVRADRLRIRQVLLNLLSNAEKFTKKGFIWVRAWRADREILVSVEDSGIGIAQADIPLIFEDYKQISEKENTGLLSRRRRHAGTGLGMSVSRALIELHGGQISVESELGEGTTFTFSLPIPIQAPEPQAQHPLETPIPEA